MQTVFEQLVIRSRPYTIFIHVKTAKRRAAEATLAKIHVENNVLENACSFEYLGSRLQCGGYDEADIYALSHGHCTSGAHITVPSMYGSSPLPQYEA